MVETPFVDAFLMGRGIDQHIVEVTEFEKASYRIEESGRKDDIATSFVEIEHRLEGLAIRINGKAMLPRPFPVMKYGVQFPIASHT